MQAALIFSPQPPHFQFHHTNQADFLHNIFTVILLFIYLFSEIPYSAKSYPVT